MPIAPRILQLRLAQVGVIRLGEKRTAQSGKSYPAKLETFRVTSPSEQLVKAVADLLGGTVKPWRGNAGPEFEVVTNATEIAVMVPPQRIDPNFELWGKGYRARMCDGDTERIRQAPCLCEAAARARYGQRGRPWPDDGRFERTKDDCKPTTRMSLMIADIPSGVGTFKCESHGWNAAAELPMLAATIAAATTAIPATLRLEQRESGRLVIGEGGQEKVDPRKYAVPVLDFFGLFTPRQAFSGQLESAVQVAIGAVQRPALAAAPAEVVVDWSAKIAAASTAVELNSIRDQIRAANAGNDRLLAEWKARGAALVAAVEQPAPAPVQPAEPVVEVVEADLEPDRDEVWTAIMREAGKVGWNLPAVEARYRERMGHDPSDEDQATGWKLTEFLGAVKAGEVR